MTITNFLNDTNFIHSFVNNMFHIELFVFVIKLPVNKCLIRSSVFLLCNVMNIVRLGQANSITVQLGPSPR